MDKTQAKRLLPLVNHHDLELKEYANQRIEYLRNQLEQSTTFDDVLKVQGKIQEIKKLLTLREEVIHKAKEG